ncbi:MAG: hypothetical protein BGO98_23985 [Myxococcales bacterium 68-20]|nr:MAG: hypothetical protein BGO98_23985 [Myxococcales bacterium 68-20]
MKLPSFDAPSRRVVSSVPGASSSPLSRPPSAASQSSMSSAPEHAVTNTPERQMPKITPLHRRTRCPTIVFLPVLPFAPDPKKARRMLGYILPED